MTREQQSEAVATWERVSADESWINPHQHIEDLITAGEGLLVALASPPAEIYPNSDKGLREMCPGVPVDVLRGIQEAAFRAGRESMAQAPPASAPPGLVALARETRDIVDGYDDQLPSVKVAQGTPFAVAVGLMRRWLLAYPLPASPQAK